VPRTVCIHAWTLRLLRSCRQDALAPLLAAVAGLMAFLSVAELAPSSAGTSMSAPASVDARR
jgi:hypothetical protein